MVSSISISQDNNGVERSFFKDDFSNDTLAQYTVTGTPTIAAGVLTMAYGDKIERVLPSTCTTGKWEMVAQFDTDWVDTDQAIYLYIGDNSYYRLLRITGDVIWSMLWINGQAKILETTTRTLASNVDFRAEVIYDGTNYTVAIYGMSGAYSKTVAASSPTVPSIAVRDWAAGVIVTAITVNEITYSPSIAFQDLFGSDTETRYMQLASTNITLPNTTGTYATAAAGDVVVASGYMTLSSDDDEVLAVPLRSYNFASGEIEVSFDNNGDGGGGADSTGLLFGYQDILNHYQLVVEDDAAGVENLKIYKVVAGTATQLGTTKDVSATYVRGNKTWLKLHWDKERGQMWAYLRDDAGTYPTTPDISDAFSAQFSYGKAGFWSAVTTAGAGNLSVRFDDFAIRAALLIGETNVPTTKTGFCVVDGFGSDSTGRLTLTGTWSIAAGILSCTAAGNATMPFQTTIGVHSFLPTLADGTDYYYFGGYRIKFVASGGNTCAVTLETTAGVAQGTGSLTVTTTAGLFANPIIITETASAITVTVSGATGTITSGTTTSTNAYPKFTVGTATCSFDNYSFSGTRYYMKPMLRGAQVDLNTPATRFSDDFNWDTSAEYTTTGTGSATVDTTNGKFLFSSTDTLTTTLNLLSSGNHKTIYFEYEPLTMKETDFRFAVGGYRYNLYWYRDSTTWFLYKYSAGGAGTSLGSYNFGSVPTTPMSIFIDASTSTLKIYINWVLAISSSNLTSLLPATSFVIYNERNAGTETCSIRALQINAIESTSTNGVAYMIGGVPHGMRYDTQEEVYLTTTTAQQTLARLRATLISTNYATDSIQWYYENITDGSSIDVDTTTKTVQIVPTAASEAVSRTTLTLGADDIGDAIKCALRRHAYALANDNQPAVFCDAFGILATITATDSVAMTDALSASRLRTTVADSVALTDAKTTRLRHTFTDSVALSDAVATRLRHTFTDSVALTDRATMRLRFVVVDSLTITDTAFAHLYKKVVQYNTITRTIIQYNELSG